MSLRILAIDRAREGVATVDFGTVVTGYPPSNCLTSRRSETAVVTTALLGGSTYICNINVVIPATRLINAVVLARTNVPPDGRFYQTAYFGATAVASANAPPLVGDGSLDLLSEQPSRGINSHAFWLTAPVVVDKVLVQMQNSGAPTNLEVGRVMFGMARELALNFDWANTVQWVDPSEVATTYGGDLIATYNGPPRRKITLPFNGIPEADRAYLYDLMRVVGTSGELFISMWPGSGGRLERDHQMWCRIANTDALTQSHVDFYGTSITFIEC